MNWTSAQDDVLRENWGKGLNASAIAAILRTDDVAVTKMAVIGRAHRLKLPQHVHVSRVAGKRLAVQAVAGEPPRKTGKQPAPKPTLAVKADGALKIKFKPQKPAPEPRAMVAGEPVIFIDLVRGQCKFILAGDGAKSLCCGMPTRGDRSSWCLHHHGIVFDSTRTTGRAMRLQKMNGTRA